MLPNVYGTIQPCILLGEVVIFNASDVVTLEDFFGVNHSRISDRHEVAIDVKHQTIMLNTMNLTRQLEPLPSGARQNLTAELDADQQVIRLSRTDETVMVTVPTDVPDDYELSQFYRPVDFFVSEATNSIFLFFQTRCRGFSPITRKCPQTCTDCPTDLIRVIAVDRENT